MSEPSRDTTGRFEAIANGTAGVVDANKVKENLTEKQIGFWEQIGLNQIFKLPLQRRCGDLIQMILN